MSITPAHTIAWVEIPVTDLDRAIAFYRQVFEFEIRRDDSGPNPMAMFAFVDAESGVSGHLYPGRPAADGRGPTVHINVRDQVEAALERLKAAGGTVLPIPVITVPAGRFAYATDPDGNALGLFQPAAG